MLLGDWLTANNVQASAFAEKIGVSKSSVSRWLDGDVRPGWDVLPRIIEATNGEVTANDFLPPDAPPPEQAPARIEPERPRNGRAA